MHIWNSAKVSIWQDLFIPFSLLPAMSEEEMAKTTFRIAKSRLKEIQRYGIDHDMTDTQIFNEAIKVWLDPETEKIIEKYRAKALRKKKE